MGWNDGPLSHCNGFGRCGAQHFREAGIDKDGILVAGQRRMIQLFQKLGWKTMAAATLAATPFARTDRSICRFCHFRRLKIHV